MTCRFLIASTFVLALGCGGSGSTTPVIADVNGALVGSAASGATFSVDGSSFDDIAAQTAGYSLDFHDSTTDAVVASATVNYASGAWKSSLISGVVPTGLTTGATYKLKVTTPHGTSNGVDFVIAPSSTFSPSTIAWSATASLPAAAQGFPAVTVRTSTGTYVYALGGNTSAATATNGKAANVANVSFNSIATTGLLGGAAWTSTTALPAPRGFSAAVVATQFNSKAGGNGTIYVLGGLDASGAAASTVYSASVNADGSISGWGTTSALPQALSGHGAAIVRGHVYVIGGNDASGNPSAAVYSAPVQSDGSLGAWTTLTSLPDKRAFHQVVEFGGTLYVLGGDNVATDPVTNAASASQSTIYYAAVNPQDGSLPAAWTTNAGSAGKNREKFSAVVAGGMIVVSGGLYNGATNGSSEQSTASIASDGSVGSFNGATGSHTISGSTGGYNFYNHAAVAYVAVDGTPHVLVLGGADVNSGAVHAEVWSQH